MSDRGLLQGEEGSPGPARNTWRALFFELLDEVHPEIRQELEDLGGPLFIECATLLSSHPDVSFRPPVGGEFEVDELPEFTDWLYQALSAGLEEPQPFWEWLENWLGRRNLKCLWVCQTTARTLFSRVWIPHQRASRPSMRASDRGAIRDWEVVRGPGGMTPLDGTSSIVRFDDAGVATGWVPFQEGFPLALSESEAMFSFSAMWQPNLETPADFRKRSQQLFKEQRKAFIERSLEAARAAGFEPLPEKREMRRHVLWLIRYQVSGLSYGEIAEQDESLVQSSDGKATVSNAVRAAAQLLELPLRPPGKPGPKPA